MKVRIIPVLLRLQHREKCSAPGRNVVSGNTFVRSGGAQDPFQQHIALKMLRVRTKTICHGDFLSGTETREARFSSRSR